ncbi:OPT oligopeptide transporter protein-domain-containing protein [Zychaea mexicana]|uniref:OPT oligopeptide transporter protein-domain-containing protein n=1 Tax=Zychaea mexicana TaxID=64656 RepID=UPI0022FE5D9B|nr:OPT oligopeptide transporter protein-domain-containing protein [Zychaea mexicana]KAI9489308.1 OPT oligopeptide transporter protein-domain-containing protein [Zychaea mexicana]
MADLKTTTPAPEEEKIEYEVDTKEKEQYDLDQQVEMKDDRPIGQEFVEEWQFTWRASVVGSLLGCLVAASNTYLGLKIGWTFGASLFGAIFSFAIIKPLSRVLPLWAGGGYFGAKENVTAQSAATTAGGLSAGFVAGVPAMYKLGLMSTPKNDAAALVLFTISAAFYGLFFAVPLRRHFVLNQDLPFPTPRATATTIISLHNSVEGEREAMRKAMWMGIFFMITFIWTLIAYWVPFFETIHILWWIGYSTGYENMMSADADWGWYFSFDWPFFGAGLMTPGSTVLSFFISSIFLYGIIGPTLVTKGHWIGAGGFSDEGETAQKFYLWPGIALMVLSSMTELFVRYEMLWRACKGGAAEIFYAVREVILFVKVKILRRGSDSVSGANGRPEVTDELFKPEELVPVYWWGTGVVISIIFTCAIMGEYFGMPVYQSIVAVIIAFILAFVGIQSSGETDINPTGSIGKMAQLVFTGMPAHSTEQLQKNNLMAGTIAASAASQSVDMVGDLKTGQLVGASPRSQFLAQAVASIPAIGIAVGLFILFAEAYPCIINDDLDTSNCEFQLVAVMAWLQVTRLLTGTADPLTRDCIIVTAVCAVIGVIVPVLKFRVIPEKYHRYVPSMSAIGIAMINPAPEIPFSMFLGWSGGKIWKRFYPKQYDDFMHSVAGGMIAGQGISALLKAVFQLGGVEGDIFYASCIMGEKANCP